MTRVKKRLLPLIAVAGLAATGCGGSSNHGSSGTGTGTNSSASSRAGFIAQLNSLCNRANNAFSAAHSTQGQVAVVSRYVARFGSLKAPPELRGLYAQYVAVLEKELAALRQGDTQALFKLAHNQAKPLVKRIGAEGCVTGS